MQWSLLPLTVVLNQICLTTFLTSVTEFFVCLFVFFNTCQVLVLGIAARGIIACRKERSEPSDLLSMGSRPQKIWQFCQLKHFMDCIKSLLRGQGLQENGGGRTIGDHQ